MGAADRLDGDLGHPAALLAGEQEILARVAVAENADDAGLGRHRAEVIGQDILVDRAVVAKRCECGEVDAAEGVIYGGYQAVSSGFLISRAGSKSGISGCRPRIRSARSRP